MGLQKVPLVINRVAVVRAPGRARRPARVRAVAVPVAVGPGRAPPPEVDLAVVPDRAHRNEMAHERRDPEAGRGRSRDLGQGRGQDLGRPVRSHRRRSGSE